MRVLVTGSSGFIATHLLNRILETTDWDVETADDISPDTHLPNADVMFSLAAHVDVPASIRNPVNTIENNIGIVLGIVNHARTHDPLIVHVSTAEVFGPGTHSLHAPAKPTNPYAASKAAQDAIFHAAAATYGIRVVTARTANVFGEHQPVSKFVPTVIRNLQVGAPVRLFGDAHRRWIHADDVADALIRLADNPVDANVTGSELLRNADIVERIAQRLGVAPRIEMVEAERPGQEDVYDVAPSDVVTDDLEAGLTRAVQWWSR